jgi:hypothetical protein
MDKIELTVLVNKVNTVRVKQVGTAHGGTLEGTTDIPVSVAESRASSRPEVLISTMRAVPTLPCSQWAARSTAMVQVCSLR